MILSRRIRLIIVALLLAPSSLHARVVRVVVEQRQLIGGGAPFGAVGAYERIRGRIYFAFPAQHPANRAIVDLRLAPRDSTGAVHAWAEFVLLRPQHPTGGSGVALIDVVNRGGITTGVFHLDARTSLPPDSSGYYGDALLLRRGITILALGWQWDVAPSGALLHFGAPPVRGRDGKPITGLVRADFTADAPAPGFSLGHALGPGHVPYPVADSADAANVLTVRDAPTAARQVVPRTHWRLTSDSVLVAGGLQVGRIYELVYRATDPVVVGAGLAGIRDVASWLKHGTTESPRDSTHLAPPIRQVIAYGVSQTGRLLRHYLYQNFNTDEAGRQALDGIFAHTAGAGRGSFNHRFAQPSRDAQPYSTFFYPTDVFPFTSRVVTDPVTGARDGLLARTTARQLPRVFYVDGGYEYWGRGASLTHTTPDGKRDVEFLGNERRYVVAGAQHSSPASWPPTVRVSDSAALPAYRGNPLDQRLALRALLMSLIDWVRDDVTPPPSAYPTIAAGQLRPPNAQQGPAIPGIRPPVDATPVWRLGFGSRWRAGIVDREPPAVGRPFTVLVPRVDSVGNDVGGIRSIELLAPLATYHPWQLRAMPPLDRMVSFRGTFVPLSRTEEGRAVRGDPRPSVERLYGTRDAFLARVDAGLRALVLRRHLLAEDMPAARRRMEATWDFVMGLGGR